MMVNVTLLNRLQHIVQYKKPSSNSPPRHTSVRRESIMALFMSWMSPKVPLSLAVDPILRTEKTSTGR